MGLSNLHLLPFFLKSTSPLLGRFFFLLVLPIPASLTNFLFSPLNRGNAYLPCQISFRHSLLLWDPASLPVFMHQQMPI